MIRRSVPGDLDALMDIWLSANRAAHSFIAETYWIDHLAEVRAAVAQAEVYVCEDAVIRGFAGLVDTYVAGIFVREGSRSQGVGTALIRYLQARKPCLTLHVYEENAGAVAFYRRHGFRLVQKSVDKATGHVEYQMTWQRQTLPTA